MVINPTEKKQSIEIVNVSTHFFTFLLKNEYRYIIFKLKKILDQTFDLSLYSH